MGRKPNAEREAEEEMAALVSSAESCGRMEALCRIPTERVRIHRDQHGYLLGAVKMLVRLHQRPVPVKRGKMGQLRLVA